MSDKRHKVPVSVNLLLEKDDSILLSLRHPSCRDGSQWGFVAGHLEPGESPKAAMIREVKEELGITLDHDALLPPTVVYGTNPEYMGFVFRCKNWSGQPQNLEPEKCKALQFFRLTEIPQNTVSYVRKSIQSICNNVPYLEIG